MVDGPISVESVIDAKDMLNDALADTRHWSLRVVGWKRALPDSYDPGEALMAQALQRRSIVCLHLLLQSTMQTVAVANEHQEFALKVAYDRRTGWYELLTLPS